MCSSAVQSKKFTINLKEKKIRNRKIKIIDILKYMMYYSKKEITFGDADSNWCHQKYSNSVKINFLNKIFKPDIVEGGEPIFYFVCSQNQLNFAEIY